MIRHLILFICLASMQAQAQICTVTAHVSRYDDSSTWKGTRPKITVTKMIKNGKLISNRTQTYPADTTNTVRMPFLRGAWCTVQSDDLQDYGDYDWSTGVQIFVPNTATAELLTLLTDTLPVPPTYVVTMADGGGSGTGSSPGQDDSARSYATKLMYRTSWLWTILTGDVYFNVDFSCISPAGLPLCSGLMRLDQMILDDSSWTAEGYPSWDVWLWDHLRRDQPASVGIFTQVGELQATVSSCANQRNGSNLVWGDHALQGTVGIDNPSDFNIGGGANTLYSLTSILHNSNYGIFGIRDANIAFGVGAGEQVHRGLGNVFIGNEAGHGFGQQNDSVLFNVSIGTGSGMHAGEHGRGGSKNIFIGAFSGYNSKDGNRLIIANDSIHTGLYGELDRGRFGFNMTAQLMGGAYLGMVDSVMNQILDSSVCFYPYGGIGGIHVVGGGAVIDGALNAGSMKVGGISVATSIERDTALSRLQRHSDSLRRLCDSLRLSNIVRDGALAQYLLTTMFHDTSEAWRDPQIKGLLDTMRLGNIVRSGVLASFLLASAFHDTSLAWREAYIKGLLDTLAFGNLVRGGTLGGYLLAASFHDTSLQWRETYIKALLDTVVLSNIVRGGALTSALGSYITDAAARTAIADSIARIFGPGTRLLPLTKIPPGSDGQYLKTTGSTVGWAAAPAGGSGSVTDSLALTSNIGSSGRIYVKMDSISLTVLADTLDASLGNKYIARMGARPDTIFVKNLTVGQDIKIKVVSAGAYAMTFKIVSGPAIRWTYGIAPTITATTGQFDWVYIENDGTDYGGGYDQNH